MAVIAIAVGGRAVTSRRTGAVAAASVPPDAPVAAVAIAIGVDPQPLAFRPLDDAPFARVPLVNRFTIDDPWPAWSSSENIGSGRGAMARRVPQLPS